MSLYNHAKNKALSFIEEGYRQADPGINTGTGSAVRATTIIPMSLIYASLFQEIDTLRDFHLGNAANLSEADMDTLAGLIERPQGSRATTTLRVYLEEIEPFELETFPYFTSTSGSSFRPITKSSYNVGDIMDDNGEIYVNVPVIAVESGTNSVSVAGSITGFTGMPIKVRRVTNVSDTQGGDPAMSNTEFLEYIRNSISDQTIGQIGGIRKFVSDFYPEAANIMVAHAGSPLMTRDEVWTEDGVNPNLLRKGVPFAAHIDVGLLDFDTQYRRAISTSFTFDESFEGRRIAVDGDIENCRTILRVIDDETIILSGPPQVGTHSASVWNDGPSIGCMADVYMYFPFLHIKTAVIDKRYFLAAASTVSSGTTLDLNIAPGFGYVSLPETGILVVREGADDEIRLEAVSASGGTYTLKDPVVGTINTGDSVSLYDMSRIEIGEDITDLPVIYVLQVDRLDPMSMEVAETIPRAEPGPYSDRGWYIGATDAAEVFSARERKTIFLDNKSDYPALQSLDITIASITGSAEIREGDTVIAGPGNIISSMYNWQYSEGREIAVTTPNTVLADVDIEDSVISGAGTSTLEIDNLDVQYSTLVGYRDDMIVVTLNGAVPISVHSPGDVMGYGDKLKLKSGLWPANTTDVRVRTAPALVSDQPIPPGITLAWISGSTDLFPEDTMLAPGLFELQSGDWVNITPSVDARACIYGETIETVIISHDSSTYIETIPNSPLPSISGASGLLNLHVTITAPEVVSNLNSSPVRVMYATQSNVRGLQATLDGGSVQSLCKDTLARSYLPSLVDATIRFRGESTTEEIYSRFVELLSDAAIETNNEVRLDVSNIIAELDEEGLADYIDVNFEVRVTNFLPDGESTVQYLNPAEGTRQDLACLGVVPPGSRTVNLRRLSSKAPLPGRGKLILGGNNPAIREVLPYEAVIDNGNDTYTLVLRGTKTTDFIHADWETAIVAVRDYDPEMEFNEGAIFIPATNRPYVRQLVIIKL